MIGLTLSRVLEGQLVRPGETGTAGATRAFGTWAFHAAC